MSNRMNEIEKKLLETVSGLAGIPKAGAYNIRRDGKLLARGVSEHINIVSKTDKDGIDIIVAPNTKNESVHIPVILSQEGLHDMVYNDFYIGDNSDVEIVAGCGVHNTICKENAHNGIHTFHIGENCHVKYIEKHVGMGENASPKVLDPVTDAEVGKNSVLEMETSQLGGVTSANRRTSAKLYENATLLVNEKIFTELDDEAKTNFDVELLGNNSKVDVVSRSVAQNNSKQAFVSLVKGKSNCFGHVECDGILSDKATISSSPNIMALHPDATLVHEAAIGKISQEQQNKLMSLGLTKEEAEKTIIKGFLK